MKNNKGFTLIEILAVLVLISLMMVIIVPSIQKVALNSKIKLCNTKISLAEESIKLWARDNYKCFEKQGGCNILSNCSTTNDIIKCESTFKTLAENNLINYDKKIETTNYVINPINNGNMNNTKIYTEFNKNNKQIKAYIDDEVKTKICTSNAKEVNPIIN